MKVDMEARRNARLKFREMMGAVPDTIRDVCWWADSPLFTSEGGWSSFTVSFHSDHVCIDMISTLKRGLVSDKMNKLFSIAKDAGYTCIKLENRTFDGFWAHYGFEKDPAASRECGMIKYL